MSDNVKDDDIEIYDISLDSQDNPSGATENDSIDPVEHNEEDTDEVSDVPVKRKKSLMQEIISYVWVIALAALLAFLIDRFVIINAKIPSSSMESTINIGDRVIGFRLAYLFSEPDRGDIIIFKWPDDESQTFIKRVIGLPGETVKISNGKVYINGEPIEEDYLNEDMKGDFGPYIVPEDSYFVLGDNRNNSKDSRKWDNTFVSSDQILAKALFVYYPHIEKLN